MGKKSQNFKITRAGYMYRDGKRIADVPTTPLNVPYDELSESEIKIVQEYNRKNWRMV